ncbi:hypothetical protein ACIPY6_02975 [Streptomyces sp. NPDC090054]|uniref:hypothetical protein n=1 Tax=Streptomyces sp. NPDC090054 TaxID=3365933 RepID=UPI003814BED3
MSADPITPTAIIPPGAPLPAQSTPPPAPPPPPPPSTPNWWTLPPPTPGPIQVHVTLHPATLPPPPTRWERLAAWLRRFGQPWQAAAALVLAVTPIPGVGVGYSIATTWAYVVEMGHDIGPWQPYALGCLPFALVATRILRRGGTVYRLFLLVVTGFGVWGAIDPFDLITLLTGVTR